MLERIWQPARLLAGATHPVFRHIQVDDDWLETIHSAAVRGPVVYVMRCVSTVDYIALLHLSDRLDLPDIGFVNGLTSMMRPKPPPGVSSLTEQLRRALHDGQAAVLFVQRAPNRGDLQPDDDVVGALLKALLEVQASLPEREVMLVPHNFVWSQRPERSSFSLVDTIFAPADELRMGLQVALNYKNCRLRAGDPLSLREFTSEQAGSPHVLAARLGRLLLETAERERRGILGPVRKAGLRVREEVLRSRELQSVITELAGPDAKGRALLTQKARNILRKLQTLPDPDTISSIELAIDTVVDRIFAGIELDMEGLDRLREATRRGPVMLLPSHRSHVDYLLLSYLFKKHAIPVPVIAAGENLSFFPLGPVLRRAGAFFIRRRFRLDRLYTAVVNAYVRQLLREGWMMELFLEGGRSRTGKLLPPRTGLLGMVVSGALHIGGQPVRFVPVSIGYERLMEEGAFERELSGGTKRPEDATELLKIGELLLQRWGRINVQFGQVLELAPFLETAGAGQRPLDEDDERIGVMVRRLAYQVMGEINRVTALTPGSVVALVLLCQGRRGVTYADLLAHCRRVTATLLRREARATSSLRLSEQGELRQRAIREVLKLYVRSGLLEQHVPGQGLTEAKRRRRAVLHAGPDVIFIAPDHKRLRLDFAKNTLIHLLVDRALVAVALLCPATWPDRPAASADQEAAPSRSPEAAPAAGPGRANEAAAPTPSEPPPPPGEPAVPIKTLRFRVLSLSRLFKFEFMFRADASFDQIFDDVLGEMIDHGELRVDDDIALPGEGHDGLDGLGWLTFYAAVIRNFLESYRIAARTLPALVRGPIADKDLLARALRVGEQMFLQGEIERSEAVSRPVIDNALRAFHEQGYLVRDGDDLGLAGSFQSEYAAKAIEARLAAYLVRRPEADLWWS